MPTRGGGDLAIRSRDRNLFFNDPTDAALVETTLFGEFVRKISLAGLTAPAQGVAYDAHRDEFLILPAAAGTRLLRYGLDGRALSALDLEQPVRGDALAYDSVEQSSYATLADGSAIGVFDGHGRLLRCLPLTDPTDTRLFDVGPRSFLRLF
ncbi:MAG: hypothetical protein EAZ36_00965 [Verrucomicrobia bacterium]|nr:MAG: hypothetical protein EAZ36_00965 [Verrucomicrobiota bacterium]